MDVSSPSEQSDTEPQFRAAVFTLSPIYRVTQFCSELRFMGWGIGLTVWYLLFTENLQMLVGLYKDRGKNVASVRPIVATKDLKCLL